MTVATLKRIPANHKVRNAFSGCSTGGGCGEYYETKGHAVIAFDNALQTYGFHFNGLDDYPDDAGRRVASIFNEFDDEVAWAIISWYRVGSGRYEFIGYIA